MRALLMRTGSTRCALSVEHVVETMRLQPTACLAGAPEYVWGVAIIRGETVPVMDLALVLGTADGRPCTRFVTLRVGARCVALAVAEVIGVVDLDARAAGVPPLLQHANDEVVAGLERLDDELLVLLRDGRLLGDEVWHLMGGEAEAE